MKKIALQLAAATAIAAGAVMAEYSAALSYLQETNGALVGCEAIVQRQAMQERLYGLDAPVIAGDIVDCTATGRERLRTAHDTFAASSPTAPLAEKARELYVAALAYADAIDSAADADALRSGNEAAARNRARADFTVEAGL